MPTRAEGGCGESTGYLPLPQAGLQSWVRATANFFLKTKETNIKKTNKKTKKDLC